MAGEPILDGYAVHEMCTAARGQPLIPWPNRLRDGNNEFAGRRYQLPLTEADKSNAIHGLVRWSKWTPGDLQPDCITMTHTLFPQPGYPHLLELAITYDYRPWDCASSSWSATREIGLLRWELGSIRICSPAARAWMSASSCCPPTATWRPKSGRYRPAGPAWTPGMYSPRRQAMPLI